MGEIAKRQNPGIVPTTTLTDKHLRDVAMFTDPGTLITVLEKKGWSLDRAIGDIVKAIDEADSPTVKIRLHKYLIELLLSNIQRSGLLGRLTAQLPGPDGALRTFSAPAVSEAVRNIRSHTGKEEDDSPDPEIQIEVPDDTCDHKPPTSRHSSQFPGIATDNPRPDSPPEEEGPTVPAFPGLPEEELGRVIGGDVPKRKV